MDLKNENADARNKTNWDACGDRAVGTSNLGCEADYVIYDSDEDEHDEFLHAAIACRSRARM